MINASYLDSAHSHTIRLITDNSNMGFDATCTDREKEFTVSSRSATYVNSSILYGVHGARRDGDGNAVAGGDRGCHGHL